MKLLWRNESRNASRAQYVVKRQTPTIRPFLPLHTHDYGEIVYIEAGECVHKINSKCQNLKRGDLFIIRPEIDTHHFIKGENPVTLLQILFCRKSYDFLHRRYFNHDRGKTIWHKKVQEPLLFSLNIAQRVWIENSFSHLLTGNNSRFELERFIMNLTDTLTAGEAAGNRPDSEDNWLDVALREILEPVHFQKGTKGFVDLCGRSHEHVERELKKKTGHTIIYVVNKARMGWASYTLTFTKMEIIDIAYDCGFSSISHFYRLFKQEYGVAPSRYRKTFRSVTDVRAQELLPLYAYTKT